MQARAIPAGRGQPGKDSSPFGDFCCFLTLTLRHQKVVVRWISRDFNTTADALANAGVILAPEDSPTGTPEWKP
jgi:hypothetical protein